MLSDLFIVTAPSGAGKTTLIKKALEYASNNSKKFVLSISHTTRKPRDGEQNGEDYVFLTEDEFLNNIKKEEYLEYAIVHGNYYGTPKSEIDQNLSKGLKVILEIDWQGALQIMKHYPSAESIFISPPSVDELRKRLTDRGLDSDEVINRRIEGAQEEMSKSNHFKHQITNISLDNTTKNHSNIMFKENHG